MDGRREDMSYHFNERDLDILNILCSNSEPMTAMDIVDQQKGLSQSTVISILRKLLKDELIKVDGMVPVGKVTSRTFSPTPLVKEYILSYYLDLYQRTHNIISAEEIFKTINN